jgi:hypothetical protein
VDVDVDVDVDVVDDVGVRCEARLAAVAVGDAAATGVTEPMSDGRAAVATVSAGASVSTMVSPGTAADALSCIMATSS